MLRRNTKTRSTITQTTRTPGSPRNPSGTGRNPSGRKRQTGSILTPGKETATATISTASPMKSTARRAVTRATGRGAIVTHPRRLKTRRGADNDDGRGMGLRSVPFQLPSIMELENPI